MAVGASISRHADRHGKDVSCGVVIGGRMKALLPNGRGRFFGVTFLSAIAAGALIGVPAVASAAPAYVLDSATSVSAVSAAEPLASGAVDAADAADAASCLVDMSSHLVRLTGSDSDPVRNPVLLVHGWLSTAMPESETGPRPVTTSTGIANSPFSRPVEWSSDGDPAVGLRSLQQRLSELPDTSVFAFDYSSMAALWVGHTATAPALAGAIECLAQESGDTVDIVAHSMGGLALRYALGGSNEGVAAHVGQVITVATPNEGSEVASAVSVIGDATETLFSSASVLVQLALPAVVGICNREMESDARVGCDIPPSARTVFAVAGDGGQALRAGSAELSSVPDWPSSLNVHAIAGDYRIRLTAGIVPPEVFTAFHDAAGAFGMDLRPAIDETIEAGDGIVGVSSATADADSSFVARCEVTVDLTTTAGSAQFGDLSDQFGGIPPLAGPCAHDRLFENDDVARDIVATLGASRR